MNYLVYQRSALSWLCSASSAAPFSSSVPSYSSSLEEAEAKSEVVSDESSKELHDSDELGLLLFIFVMSKSWVLVQWILGVHCGIISSFSLSDPRFNSVL